MSRGVWIALEGGEGCGKSTQARMLAERFDAVLTREPGGTTIGSRIREITHDVSLVEMDPRAEAFLMAADRAQHFAEVIEPALQAGKTVVSDRSVYSSMAYQGYGRGLDPRWVWDLGFAAYQEVFPTVVVLLEVPEPVAAERRALRLVDDRFEQADSGFHRRVVDGFRQIAAGTSRMVTVDADGPAEWVLERIVAAVESHDSYQFTIRQQQRGVA